MSKAKIITFRCACGKKVKRIEYPSKIAAVNERFCSIKCRSLYCIYSRHGWIFNREDMRQNIRRKIQDNSFTILSNGRAR